MHPFLSECSVKSSRAYSPLFLRILSKRGFDSPEKIAAFLEKGLEGLHSPLIMKGMEQAVRRIRTAVNRDEKILIHGDYDVDGITGAAILARTLAAMGANHEVFLPDRAVDGYGVSLRAIEKAIQEKVALLIDRKSVV